MGLEVVNHSINGSIIENTCFRISTDEVRAGELVAATTMLYFCPEAAIIIGSGKMCSYFHTIKYNYHSPSFSAQGMVIKNMSFKVGQTLTIVGVPKPDASR